MTETKRYLKTFSVDPNHKLDSEVHDCIQKIPNISISAKELIVDFFRKTENPVEALRMLHLNRRLECGGLSKGSLKRINDEIKQINIKLGLIKLEVKTPNQEKKDRIDFIQSRLNSEFSESYKFRLKGELRKLMSEKTEDE